MAVRIRASGEIVCAARFPALSGDVYLDDDAHYRIAVELLAIEPLPFGRWRFVAQGARKLGDIRACEAHCAEEVID